MSVPSFEDLAAREMGLLHAQVLTLHRRVLLLQEENAALKAQIPKDQEGPQP